MEEPGRLQCEESDTTERLHFHFLLSCIGERNGDPLQCSCLENPRDRGAWKAAVHGVVKSWTRLSDFTFTSYFCALEKEMATHSSVPAWRIPGTEDPVGLSSMGSHRVRHNWCDLAAAAAAEISSRKLEIPREHFMQEGLNKGHKWYGPNRSRRYWEEVARIHRETIQKRIFVTQITMMMWSLT